MAEYDHLPTPQSHPPTHTPHPTPQTHLAEARHEVGALRHEVSRGVEQGAAAAAPRREVREQQVGERLGREGAWCLV